MKNYFLTALNAYLDNYKGLPQACWQGIILIFLESCAIGIIFFLSVYFVSYLKIDISISGVIIAFYSIGTVIGGSSCGFLSDKFSSRTIAIINLIVESICMFCLEKIKTPFFLAIDLFILGIVTYGFMTSINVWMLTQCNTSKNLVKAVNISRVALNAGFGLSGIMIGFLSNYNFQYVFYLYSAILAIASGYLIFYSVESKREKLIPNLRNNEIKKEISLEQDKKIIITASFCLFFVGLIISQLSVTYPIYVKELFPIFGIKAVSILFILDTVLIVLFQAPLVNMLSNYNSILMVGLGAFLIGLSMLILRFSFTFYLAIVSCVILTTGEMIFIAMTQLVLYKNSADNKKGRSIGLYQSIYASSKIIGPVTGSYMYFHCGGASIWYFSALIGITCLIACYNRHKKTANNSLNLC